MTERETLERAAQMLADYADSLRQCHTLPPDFTDWAGEASSKREWQRLRGSAAALRALAGEIAGLRALAAEAEGSKRLVASLIQELRNIAEARRYDRKHFADDEDFADWAQSRCRFVIDRAIAGRKG